MWMIARPFLRTISPRGWAVILALLLLASALTAFYFHGRRDERGAEADRDQAVVTRAAEGRETAAGERAADTRTIQSKLDERNRDAERTPDSPPDDRELRRRCRQLRDAGTTGLPACRGFEG